jgi:hypothetical protein
MVNRPRAGNKMVGKHHRLLAPRRPIAQQKIAEPAQEPAVQSQADANQRDNDGGHGWLSCSCKCI